MPSAAKRRRSYWRGIAAEWVACLYLMCKGYRPLARRFKTPVGEIDLIMKRGGTVVFVEVKARKSHSDAAASIHAGNQARVVQAAQWFVQTRPKLAALAFRFDAVTVSCYMMPHHIPHAFS